MGLWGLSGIQCPVPIQSVISWLMSRGVQPWAAGPARTRAQAPAVRYRRAHGGLCSSPIHLFARARARGSGPWRRSAAPLPAACRRVGVVSFSLREFLDLKRDPVGWGDSCGNRLSCRAHTDAQPRRRSPTRQLAMRSLRVRCRPRRTSVATPKSPQRGGGALDCADANAGAGCQCGVAGAAVAAGAVVGVVCPRCGYAYKGFQADGVAGHGGADVGGVAQRVGDRDGRWLVPTVGRRQTSTVRLPMACHRGPGGWRPLSGGGGSLRRAGSTRVLCGPFRLAG